MAKAPNSTARIAMGRETTEGVAATSGFFVRFNTADASNAFEAIESEEIRPGRLPSGGIVVDATGTVNLQSQFTKDFDTILEAGMLSTFTTTVNLSGASINVTTTGATSFTLTDAATATAFTNVAAGQWLRLTGFNTNAGTIYAHITTWTSASVVTCEGFVDTGVGTYAAVVPESGQTDIAIKASMLRIGEVKHTHTIEEQLHTPSATDVYRLWKKAVCGSLSMQMAPKQLIRISANFQAGVSVSTTTANTSWGPLDATHPAPAGTGSLMNAISHIRQVMIGNFGVPTTLKMTSLNWTLNNNIEALSALGVFGADEITPGVVGIQGTAGFYIEDATLLAQVENLTPSKFAYILQDAEGNGYIFSQKSLDWTADPTPVRSRTGAVILEPSWTGKIDAEGIAFQIDRFVV